MQTVKIKLDERLSVIASLVRFEKTVADIGSDHALLPCFLWQSGWTDIIAADINPKPLESARKTLEKYNVPIDDGLVQNGVKLVLSDGFENLPPRDDIIIAGMGGETIAEILSGCKYKDGNTRFILQPMTRHETLRRELYLQGFKIIEELFAAENSKPYTVIYAKFTGETKQIDDVFSFTGKQKNPVYIRKQLEKIQKLAKGNPRYDSVAAEIKKYHLTLEDL